MGTQACNEIHLCVSSGPKWLEPRNDDYNMQGKRHDDDDNDHVDGYNTTMERLNKQSN